MHYSYFICPGTPGAHALGARAENFFGGTIIPTGMRKAVRFAASLEKPWARARWGVGGRFR